jgi:hypothetical protein
LSFAFEKVFTVPFNYRGGGLHAAVGFISSNNAVIILNHYDPAEDGGHKVNISVCILARQALRSSYI